MAIRRSADRPTVSAVSFTGRCQLAIIELRMKYFVGRALCARPSRRRAAPRSRTDSGRRGRDFYSCNPISRHGSRPVTSGCFDTEAATTTAHSETKAHENDDSHECLVPQGDNVS